MTADPGIPDFANIILDKIIKDGIKEGSLLEVILFDGARYNNGVTVGHWGEYSCRKGFYSTFTNLSKEPGLKIVGYLRGISEDGITLQNIINFDKELGDEELGDDILIDKRTIHSYKKLN